MSETLLWILGATFLDSLLGLAGIFSFWVKEKLLRRTIFYLVAFAAGALIGGAFFHLLPESMELLSGEAVSLYLTAGFVLFLLMEVYFHWHHCQECKIHPFTYLMLVGDVLHNFIDGLVIAASFLVSIPLGVITTAVIIGHELPQELGIFGVALMGGLDKKKALLYSFAAQSSCILGGLAGYFLYAQSNGMLTLLLPLAAGGFLYIAASDLIPELHKHEGNQRLSGLLLFFIGLIFMWAVKYFAGA